MVDFFFSWIGGLSRDALRGERGVSFTSVVQYMFMNFDTECELDIANKIAIFGAVVQANY